MRLILLPSLFLAFNTLINAQTISNGLYVNKERNEFVIVRNDTVQFRYCNCVGLITYSVGEGVLKDKGNGKYHIKLSTSFERHFNERIATLHRYRIDDDKLGVQIFTQDNLPMDGMGVEISLLQLQRNRLQRRRNHFSRTDINGQLFLDENWIDYFDRRDVLIKLTNSIFFGYTPIEKTTRLERGYNYVIISHMPPLMSFVAKDNEWSIEVLNENEILLVRKNAATKLKKILDDFPHSDFPFDKDIKPLNQANNK